MLQIIWKALKVQRRVAVGPVALNFQFTRAAPISRLRRLGLGRASRQHGRIEVSPMPARVDAVPGEQTALLFGVGPGLGEALVARLHAEGFRLGVVARNGERLQHLLDRLPGGERHRAYVGDVTMESSVDTVFSAWDADFGAAPTLVVYALQSFCPGTIADIEVPAFELGLRHNCFGAFLVARRACRAMGAAGRGTLLLVGSTSSLIGREAHLNLVAGKFGQRGMAQVLAREMWPQGVHVAHVMIDADIDEGRGETHPQSAPADIAETLLFLHRQPRTAWTSELDLRPWNERFWQHC
ncbi:SDR family NAD(P)-dependent oxidoreductase [Roseateles chitosanitabidus]|uniref:SDR family NAD(P)-dependent oxidoreductase n=1 Tax=Roseateles chitosanitabidus TaxID=65048 RepID=UPI00082BF1B1|nr:SDR family NAD(P)-dependent oxidoreductase [Roseateles chitosanitabidus]MBO9684979.1 SDR family NAD(P)-dependent oxidoreductase [Roseateles chitosanitabidus]